MVRKPLFKWERSTECKPAHNIISSDFSKFHPVTFTCLSGKPHMPWVLSYEYQRMWIKERDAWRSRVFPEHSADSIDHLKAYVASFKNAPPVVEVIKKEPFIMKKFKNIPAKTVNRRSPGDKAMNFSKIKNIVHSK